MLSDFEWAVLAIISSEPNYRFSMSELVEIGALKERGLMYSPNAYTHCITATGKIVLEKNSRTILRNI